VDRGGADWELGSRTAAEDWADIGPSRNRLGEGHGQDGLRAQRKHATCGTGATQGGCAGPTGLLRR
jgi:hypothetical protein